MQPSGLISIHALREEGDLTCRLIGGRKRYFYPRPPRGGRLPLIDDRMGCIRFLSTPSARRATGGRGLVDLRLFDFYPRPPRGGRLSGCCRTAAAKQFLSTPSARRATKKLIDEGKTVEISIHALREEGDERLDECVGDVVISIHALREEGDKMQR